MGYQQIDLDDLDLTPKFRPEIEDLESSAINSPVVSPGSEFPKNNGSLDRPRRPNSDHRVVHERKSLDQDSTDSAIGSSAAPPIPPRMSTPSVPDRPRTRASFVSSSNETLTQQTQTASSLYE